MDLLDIFSRWATNKDGYLPFQACEEHSSILGTFRPGDHPQNPKLSQLCSNLMSFSHFAACCLIQFSPGAAVLIRVEGHFGRLIIGKLQHIQLSTSQSHCFKARNLGHAKLNYHIYDCNNTSTIYISYPNIQVWYRFIHYDQTTKITKGKTTAKSPLGHGRSLFKNQKAGHTPGPCRVFLTNNSSNKP